MIPDDDFEELPKRETAWQALDRITAYRKRLLAAGYEPLPVNGKKVLLEDWSNITATDAIISKWAQEWPDHSNTGILTRKTPALDIDITDEETAEELEALAENMLGKSAVRIGLAPKRAIAMEPLKARQFIALEVMDAIGAALEPADGNGALGQIEVVPAQITGLRHP